MQRTGEELSCRGNRMCKDEEVGKDLAVCLELGDHMGKQI